MSRVRETPGPTMAMPVDLNYDQRQFVQYQKGCAVLQAAVGTGKTLVLAERAAEAIRRGVDPSRIACVTFTNRAANEMRQRIIARCNRRGKDVVISTFHALCAWMLRTEAKRVGIPTDFVIFDEQDSIGILCDLAPDRGEREAREIYDVISRRKTDAKDSTLRSSLSTDQLFASLSEEIRRMATAYQEVLRANHALDFADLIFYTRCMFERLPEIRERWAQRFSMIQVDEMQDTHLSEYRVLRVLAGRCQNMVLVGDFDQTIYEWRGSTPDTILNTFEQDFPDVRWFGFRVNYRATKTLIDVAATVAGSYSERTLPQAAASAHPGAPVTMHFAASERAEAQWIGRRIQELVGAPVGRAVPPGRIAVLVRPNHRGITISTEFERLGIPHVTVEAYEFFRRREIKDALAYLRLITNPYENRSLHRILMRSSPTQWSRVTARVQEAEHTGLRPVDLVRLAALKEGDPMGPLLDAYQHGAITVFDTETTGLRPGTDQIVELAALRLEKGQVCGAFHRYLRNTVPVEDSRYIHGLSDDFLAQNGQDPSGVLREFLAFSSGSLLVGHNVRFDLRMLRTYGQSLGLPIEPQAVADTLEFAHRLVDTDKYTLAALAHFFGIDDRPAHRAMDDVRTTCAVLDRLIPLAARHAASRRGLLREMGPRFEPMARQFEAFRQAAITMRPPDLLLQVLRNSGLGARYEKEPRRIDSLRELHRIFSEHDDPEIDPFSSLEAIVAFASLARNVDRLDPGDQRVRVLTVHQAKGLEFDVVFVAGLTEDEFPGYWALKQETEPEERRVFYVAVTRARERLYLTGHSMCKGYRRVPSRYFSLIGPHGVEEGSSEITRAVEHGPAV